MSLKNSECKACSPPGSNVEREKPGKVVVLAEQLVLPKFGATGKWASSLAHAHEIGTNGLINGLIKAFLFHSISASALKWSVNPEKHRVISD
jgi:hypothetical protein